MIAVVDECFDGLKRKLKKRVDSEGGGLIIRASVERELNWFFNKKPSNDMWALTGNISTRNKSSR